MASERERTAVTAARAIVAARYPDCDVALLAGSVVRGEATHTSDLDLLILTRQPGAPYRESFAAHGWPVEAFVHTLASWREFVAADIARRRPSLAQMAAEGVVLRDLDGLAEQFKTEALALLEAGPPTLAAGEMEDRRYGPTDLLGDFIGETSYEGGLFAAQLLAAEAADFVLAYHRRWTGRGKSLWRALERYDAKAAQRLAAALREYACEGRKAAVVAWVDAALAPAGGRLFEGYLRRKEEEAP